MINNINIYILSNSKTIKEAMKQLDIARSKILFIIDENYKLIGSLTDGDIRRWILSEGTLDSNVCIVANPKPFFVNSNYNSTELKKIFLEKKYVAVPICDHNNVLKDILLYDQFIEEDKLNIYFEKIDAHVVIMAGGKGTRLEPFTKVLPKPLIPIGDKTIIELIIEKFTPYQINDFYISVNHKAKIIKSYFEDVKRNYTIQYIEEENPLGTIGALSLIKSKVTKPIIITNCDIIINADYSEFLKFHIDHNYDLSLIGSMMNYKIPYGVCTIGKDGILEKFTEKPEYSILASTGMYIINPKLINEIPENTFYDITELMMFLKKHNRKIGVYPISEESWMDTGEWDQYNKTISKLK
jgi:dTDP-glucose pyrophosphorylase